MPDARLIQLNQPIYTERIQYVEDTRYSFACNIKIVPTFIEPEKKNC